LISRRWISRGKPRTCSPTTWHNDEDAILRRHGKGCRPSSQYSHGRALKSASPALTPV
jgi:hypothetical protein